MVKTEPRIDAYIEKAQPFAQPILTHVRALVHKAVPDAEETIKWGMPHFTLNGKIVAGMAAFKAHASFGIWAADDEAGGDGKREEQKKEGMGSFGKLASKEELPSDSDMTARLKQRADLIRSGETKSRAKSAPKPPLPLPDDFAAALGVDHAANSAWQTFAPGQKREYIEWIVEAKRPETRAKRLADAVEWIAQGKTRNWKYQGC